MRVAHAGLGGEVDDAVEAVSGKAGVDRGAVGEIGADEGVGRAGLAGGVGQDAEAGFLEARVVVVVHAVEADHLVAALEQAPGGVEADEAGVSGHENLHQKRPSVWSRGKRPLMS